MVTRRHFTVYGLEGFFDRAKNRCLLGLTADQDRHVCHRTAEHVAAAIFDGFAFVLVRNRALKNKRNFCCKSCKRSLVVHISRIWHIGFGPCVGMFS